MSWQALLERERQLSIGCVLLAAGPAIREVRLQRGAKLGGQGAATTSEQVGACFGAIHVLHLE